MVNKSFDPRKFLIHQFQSFIVVGEALTLEYPLGRIPIQAVANTNDVPLDRIYLFMDGLDKLPEGSYRGVTVEPLLERAWFKVLGRHSSGFGEASTFHPNGDVLAEQMGYLLKNRPKKFYRFLIIAADAPYVYGDVLIKRTAYKLLFDRIKTLLPDVCFKIDFSLMPFAAPGGLYLLNDFDCVDRFLPPPLNWAQLSGYDGVWNLLKIIRHPHFEELPFIDYLLWLLGLDPKSFTPQQKRCQALVPKRAFIDVEQYLSQLRKKKYYGKKLVLFCFTAS